jgi:hypothetical protein
MLCALCWSVLGPLSRASRSNLTLTSLTIRLRALYQEPWRFRHLHNTVIIIQWFIPLTQAFTQHSPLHPLLPSYLSPLASVMKFAFEIKTKPVTQASIIVTMVTFSFGSLVLIAIYSQSPLVSLRCCSGNHCVLGPPSSPMLTARSTIMDAQDDEAMAAIAPPNCCASSISSQGIPLVLQIFSIPGSSDPEEFLYNTYATLESGNFAAAHAFLIHHSHVIIYHNCPNAIAFQELYPSANIG